MVQKIGLVMLYVFQGALMCASAQESHEFSSSLRFVLERLVNPEQTILGSGGTHNLIHYACLDEKRAVAGFLPSSSRAPLEKAIGTIISDNRAEPAHTFSVGKARFALFHASGTRCLVLRRYERGSIDVFNDQDVPVEGLQDAVYGECLVTLSISHGALFRCWSAQAGVGKMLQVNPPDVSRVVHTPPEVLRRSSLCLSGHRETHAPSHFHTDYVQPPLPSFPAPFPPVPAFVSRDMRSPHYMHRMSPSAPPQGSPCYE